MEIVARVLEGKMCIGRSYRLRKDPRENKILMFPSMRILLPMLNDVHCIDIGDDKVAVKIYRDRRKTVFMLYDLSNENIYRTNSIEELETVLRNILDDQNARELTEKIIEVLS